MPANDATRRWRLDRSEAGNAKRRGRPARLIDGGALKKLIGSVSRAAATSRPKATLLPACPRCGTPMVERMAKQGKHAGRSFWGCAQYPKCTGIVQISQRRRTPLSRLGGVAAKTVWHG